MRLALGLISAALVVAAAAEHGSDVASRPVAAQSSAPGEVLVRFQPTEKGISTVTSRLDVFSAAAEIRINRRLDLWKFRFNSDQLADATIDALLSDPGVAHAQRNHVFSRALNPNDTLYTRAQRPHHAAINLPAAWDTERGDPDVVVAVIDSGVDIDHPELDSRIWTNTSDPPDGEDNDSNGCIDDYHGCSFQSDPADGSVSDLDGHGTFVAGIIAAESNNGEGIAGVAPGTTILPVRALDAAGGVLTDQLMGAIAYASDVGADIINLSLAWNPQDPSCPIDKLIEDSLESAHDAGAVILAAAGNFANACVAFPARHEDVIAVSASGQAERPDIRAFFSNYGPEIDVTAPGTLVVSTCPVPTAAPSPTYCDGGAYGMGDGTSFSTPLVSGVAALLLAHDPSLTNDGVRDRLIQTAHDLPDGQHPNWDGAGRVDAAAALGVSPVYSAIDITVPDPAHLTLAVAVDHAPGCRAEVWNEVVDEPEVLAGVIHHASVSGHFGVSECATHWPPAQGRPWRLEMQNFGRKALTVNGWSLSSSAVRCSAEAPVVIPGGSARDVSITCDNAASNDDMSGAKDVDITHIPLRYEQYLRSATVAVTDPVPSCVPGAPPGGFAFTRTVWYRVWPSGQPVWLSVDAFGSEMELAPVLQNVKTVIAVYRASGGGLQEVACNVRFAPPVYKESRVVWVTDGASAYYVMAAAYQSVPIDTLRLNFSRAENPANDSIAGALPLSLAAPTHVQAAHSATRDAADPPVSCFPALDFSLWFRVTEPAGMPLTLSTAGSGYNTVAVAFRRDESGLLTEVACNNDEAPGVPTSRVSWVSDGGEYYVLIASPLGFSGTVLRADLQSP